MWGMAPLENFDRAAKYKLLGRPLKIKVPDNPWKQGEVVKPLQIPDELRTEDFYLGDFALAMKPGSPVTKPGRPPIEVCSPERLHNYSPSFACDIWSYMCIFTELYLGYAPFHTWANGGMVTTIVQRLGPLPAQWKGRYCPPEKALDSWYDQDKTPHPEYNFQTLIQVRKPEVSLTEREHALSLFSKGFNLYPENRPTATQLLHDPSFKALIDMYCG